MNTPHLPSCNKTRTVSGQETPHRYIIACCCSLLPSEHHCRMLQRRRGWRTKDHDIMMEYSKKSENYLHFHGDLLVGVLLLGADLVLCFVLVRRSLLEEI